MTGLTKLAAALVLAAAALPAFSQQLPGKIGFINTERVMRESVVSQRAQKALEAEFRPRDDELATLADRMKRMQQDLEKNSVTMSESVRATRERELADMNREFQRRQREFNEDIQQKRNEVMAQVIQRANGIIRSVAEREKIDIIFQDAVYVNPRVDITDQVIKALDAAGASGGK